MADVFETSYLRGNCIAWLPIKKEDRVLYIGRETDVAAKKCMEMSDYAECAREISQSGESDTYDYIICFGKQDVSALSVYNAHLKASGKLILAVGNVYGLKYLAGVKEYGSDRYFQALETADDAEGCTKEELETLVKSAGFDWLDFYYPFPDQYFTMSLYSDDYLPKQGELIDQTGNFDQERLVLFDESKAMNAVIARGKFKEFSNAYVVAAGKGDGLHLVNAENETISYVKFSNDRGLKHNIRTYITKSADGKPHLIKMADSASADAQIENILKTEHVLQELYADSRFKINTCHMRKNGVELEFLKGHTMEEELDALVEAGRYTEAVHKMTEVFTEIASCKAMQEFQITEEFKKVFGEVTLPAGIMAVPVGDIDMIMPNILIGENGSWSVIDYEWSFHFPVPVNFIIYRAIHYYAQTTASRRVLDAKMLYEKAGITDAEVQVYESMETSFQNYVLDGHVPMRQLYKEEGKPAYHLTSLLHIKNEIEHTRMMQVYFDRGNGTREEDCMNFHSKSLDGVFHLEIPVDHDVTAVRIDPAAQACTAKIERLCFSTSKEQIVDFYGPVHKVQENIYLFEGEDPFLLIMDIPSGEKMLYVDMRVETMSPKAAEILAPKIDLKYKIKKMLKK